MPYSLRCPGCGRAIPYGAEDAGKRGRCPSCGAEIVAPGGTADPEAATRALPASALPTREGETPPWARTRASERLERSGEGASPSSVLEPGLAQEIARAKSDPARRFGP